MSATADNKGLKRICMSCGARFYDLNKTPIICPACQTEFTGEIKVKARRGRISPVDAEDDEEEENQAVSTAAVEDDEVEEEEDTVSLEDVEDDDDLDEDEDDISLDDDDLDDLDDDLDDLDEDEEIEEAEDDK